MGSARSGEAIMARTYEDGFVVGSDGSYLVHGPEFDEDRPLWGADPEEWSRMCKESTRWTGDVSQARWYGTRAEASEAVYKMLCDPAWGEGPYELIRVMRKGARTRKDACGWPTWEPAGVIFLAYEVEEYER